MFGSLVGKDKPGPRSESIRRLCGRVVEELLQRWRPVCQYVYIARRQRLSIALTNTTAARGKAKQLALPARRAGLNPSSTRLLRPIEVPGSCNHPPLDASRGRDVSGCKEPGRLQEEQWMMPR